MQKCNFVELLEGHYLKHAFSAGPCFKKDKVLFHARDILWPHLFLCLKGNQLVLSMIGTKNPPRPYGYLPPAYVVRGKVMFWHASVHLSICLSTGGVPISHNALQHFPECHEAGGTGQVPPRGGPGTPRGGTPVRYPRGVREPPLGGVPQSGTPRGVRVPPPGVPRSGTPPGGGLGTPRGGTPVRYTPRGGFWVPPRGEVSGQVHPPRGYPGQVPPGGGPGTPPGGTPVRYPPWGGLGTPGGYPSQVHPRGGFWVPPRGRYPVRYTPPGGSRYPPRGGTQVGQQKEYSLHGGRYASCVHAGGLSCLIQ